MKKTVWFFLGFLFLTSFSFAQTTLLAGDIAITGVNMDNPDEISVVFLVDIESGTEIKFTDNGWLASNDWRGGEGIHTWTASTAYSAGDEIVITTSGPALATTGDQIIAYQNTSDMVAAINDEGEHVWQADATSAATSALPQGLTNGTNCVALIEIDNYEYDRSVTSGTKSDLLSAINNYLNWDGSNSTRQTLSTAGFTITEEGEVVNATDFSIQYITSTKMNITWTKPSGTYLTDWHGVAVFVRQGSANNGSVASSDGIDWTGSLTFESGTAFGNGYTVANHTLNTNGNITVTGLTEGQNYHVIAYTYKTVGGDANDDEWSAASNEINDQAEVQGTTDFSASAGNTQVGLSWTNYTGSQGTWWDQVLILAKSGSVVDGTPSGDGSAYTANAAFESGTEIGTGNYVVFKGTGTSETVTSLTNSTTYYFRAFVRYGSDWTDAEQYKDANGTPEDLPDIIISEIMQDPDAVLDGNGEWFEIYNAGSTTVNIDGWSISDAGSDSHTIDNGGTLNIAAGSFLVLGIDSDSGTNGGYTCNYEYTGINLSNGDDELIIKNGSGTEIDRVEWDGGTNWPDPTGASMVFTGTPLNNNNDYNYWTTADARESSYTGETGDNGSPGINGNQQTLPVTLSSFTAQYINDTPTLCWTTQSETNNAGWNVYRSETEEFEAAIQINTELIPGAGTTSEPTDYIYEDENEVISNSEYWYWLESVDYSGETESYGPITLFIPEDEEEPGSPEIPGIYGLHQNYPNPFNPNTEISFMLRENCIGELSVYNIKGEKISTLFQNESVSKDEIIRTNWDGKDDFGKAVSSGIYLYKLRTNKENFVRKMILMK